ncbi:MAG: T9SS type A sorting domain-containing protein [Armatimonadetes bacterium]|nr:T9SS type A sorting domain-containing protein [Armatimonadota bacterium]
MKKKINLNCLLLFVILFIPSISVAYKGIERGTEPEEIYISSRWYATFQCGYYGLYYSTNNGEDIELKYYTPNPFAPDSINLDRPHLISDMTPGVLYCRTSEPYLWISNNYGENWEFVEVYGASMYNAGCVEGEIYRRYVGLSRSDDYGSNFELVIDSLCMVTEIGISPGELYGINGNYIEGFKIHYRNDYGGTFTQQCILDSIIPVVANPYPTLSRGTEQGELYLITWDSLYRYYIYRSTDYGQTFEFQYQSEYINTYMWLVYYTAGREPGSFYVMMYSYDDLGFGTYLKIFYSNDYAETFTEYFHHLTEDYFVSVEDQPINQPSQEITLNNFPNPFNPETTIHYQLPFNIENPVIEIFNIKGEKVKSIYTFPNGSLGTRSVVWDGTDNYRNQVSSGVYLYRVKSDNFVSKPNKMILLK